MAAASRPLLRPRVRPRGPLAEGLGLVAGVVALVAGGIAAGVELERRVVTKRLYADAEADREPFFSLRSPGPPVTTPDGVVLHTEVDEPDSPSELTLLFVHGYALSLDCWHFQRRHYRGRVRQVLYDQRSHGRSSRSDPNLCRVPQLAADLTQVLDEVVGEGPVVLVGHSMGGMAMMRLAQDRPEWFGERIVGVALFSTAAGEMAEHSPIKGLPGRAFSRIAEPLMATLNRVPELVEKGRRASTDLAYVVTRRLAFGSEVPVSYVEFMSDMLADTPLDVVADFYPGFAELDLFAAFETLSRVECAVIGGEDDVITPITHTDRIIEVLPGAEVRRLPGCGHMGIIEHAAEFNAVLDGLLERARRNLAAPTEPPMREKRARARR